MDASSPLTARRVPVLGWVVIALVVAVGAAVAIPLHYKSQMVARQNNALATLGMLKRAEETWRQGDCDRNGVADYWTRDVAGLH